MDRNIEEDIQYIYKGKSFNYPLSSFAFKEYLKEYENKEMKVILLYPVSIPLNEGLKNINSKKENYKSFFDGLSQLIPDNNKIDDYLKNPEELLSKHPHNTYADGFLVLHSNGNYLGKELKTNLHSIILHILVYLINIYLREEFDEIYIDISSGLNIYLTGLMEALRYFIVWSGLYNLGNNKKVNGYISYTDPIIGNKKDEINIYLYEVKYKSFFTSPIDYTKVNQGLPKRLVEDSLCLDRSIKNKVKDYLESFLILFSCFYNAAPLYLFMNNFQSTDEIKGLMLTIIDKILSKYKESWYSSPKLEFSDFSKLLLSFGFFYGLKNIIKINKIENNGYAKLLELRNFADILESYSLYSQSSLLKTQLIKELDEKTIKFQNEWQLIVDSSNYNISEEQKKKKIDPRNFFAHAGFANTITLVKKEGNDILVTYDKKRLDEVREILLKRVI